MSAIINDNSKFLVHQAHNESNKLRGESNRLNNGGVCNLLLHVDDRDELATVNMLLATQSVVHHKSWPSHLCRPCS